MTEAHNELGRVASLRANAVGQPGSRRFRLLVESRSHGSAILWMEKEQLFNLGEAIKRIIAIVDEQGRGHSAGHSPPEWSGEPPVTAGQPVEFQVGRLAIGYDERSETYLIAAYSVEDPEAATAVVSLTASQQEVDALADEAFEVCAAGRPRCILCGAPMGPERHICPRHNGSVIPEA